MLLGHVEEEQSDMVKKPRHAGKWLKQLDLAPDTGFEASDRRCWPQNPRKWPWPVGSAENFTRPTTSPTWNRRKSGGDKNEASPPSRVSTDPCGM